MTIQEQNGTSPKKVRGRAKRSIELLDIMFDIAQAAQPITGRGVGYKLFVQKGWPGFRPLSLLLPASRGMSTARARSEVANVKS